MEQYKGRPGAVRVVPNWGHLDAHVCPEGKLTHSCAAHEATPLRIACNGRCCLAVFRRPRLACRRDRLARGQSSKETSLDWTSRGRHAWPFRRSEGAPRETLRRLS